MPPGEELGTASSGGCRLFIHVPKTAGTSFRLAAAAALGERRVLLEYGEDVPESSPLLRKHFYPSSDPMAMLALLRSSDAQLLSGHFSLKKYAGIIGAGQALTFLREPVARVISHYRHVARHHDFRGSLLEFAKLEDFRNVQARLLNGYDPSLLALAGITERYDESIAMLEHYWGWQLEHRRSNVGDAIDRAQPAPDAREVNAICELNALDLELYRRAGALLDNSLLCRERGICDEPRGSIKLLKAGSGVAGWAFYRESDQPVEVEILVNGRVRERLVATRFNVHAAALATPRRGYVGFASETLGLDGTESVSIRESRYGLVLDSKGGE